MRDGEVKASPEQPLRYEDNLTTAAPSVRKRNDNVGERTLHVSEDRPSAAPYLPRFSITLP